MTTLLKTNINSLIVIDSRVADWNSLINNINPNATLLVLDSLRDGLIQIAEAVGNATNIDSIHIISHGNVGSLLLGSSNLNSNNLSDYQALLTSIGNSLSANGDILLYGCDVAQGDVGQQFIEQLSVLTGADIAASTNLTGAVNTGGDWVLEAHTGAIESSTISLQTYTNTLIANIAPTLTTFSSPVQTGAVNSPVTITFADLLAKGNAADSDGTVNAFVIKAVNSGTLQFYDYITPAVGAPYWSLIPRAWGNPASSPNVNDTLNAYNKAVWTPPVNNTGIVNAFTVVAVDNSFTESATPIQATIQLTSNIPTAMLGIFFAAKVDYTTGSTPRFVSSGDFNGDGNLDLVIANQFDKSASVLLGTGSGTFAAKVDYATGVFPHSISTGDFNGDGKLDLAVANGGEYTVSVLLGTGAGMFAAKVDYVTGSTAWSSPASVSTGDFNGDGKLDLAVANSGDNTVSVLLGTGMGTFAAKVDYATGINPQSVSTGDFNGDGKLDLAVANQYDWTVSVLLGAGMGTFTAKVDTATGSGSYIGLGAYSVTTGDFNGDGKVDLAVANPGSNTVSVLLGNGNGTFAAKVDYATGIDPISVSTGDFNGDGTLDLVVTNSISNTVSVLLGTGTGTFAAKVDIVTGSGSGSVSTGDFNGDGNVDLAVANSGDNTVSVLLNNPTPTIISVNHVPSGTDNVVTTLEDTAYTFTTANFGFTDPNDNPANTLLSVIITTLPTAGSLQLSGVPVIVGQAIHAANITSGLLKFVPATNANGSSYDNFTFKVQDNGGTANGGVDTDNTANTLTINVTALNDMPAGIDRIVTTVINMDYTFGTTDFRFTDINDSPANSLLNVIIATLPPTTEGSLQLNGVAVTAGQVISAANIASGLLKFVPAANVGGNGVYTSFTFKVQDNGGTINGGVDTDSTANTLSIIIVGDNPPTLTPLPTVNYIDTAFVDTFATAAGVLFANDVDANTSLTYGITGGTDNGATMSKSNAYGTLTVTKATGAYSFVANSAAIEPLTADTTDSTLNVTVSDGTLTANQAFTVSITQNGVTESLGNDTLTGSGAVSNNINALAGDDILDGGASDVYNPSIIDRLNGGAGNDTFLSRGFFGAGYYNGGADTDLLDFSQADAYTAGRRSAEGAGVNVDLAAGKASTYYLSATNYTWADANGQLALTSIENIIGTNQNDQLYGDANANTLEGGAGNDVLYGAGGIDTLKGGIGNDTYYVGYAGDVLDTVTEITGEGNDIVWSALSAYTLADNVETLTLLAGAISGTGNGLDNTLVGNSISNTLNGGAGNDTLDGGVSDVYNPSVIDTLNGDAGNDTFLSRGFFGAGNYNGGADTDLLDFSQSDNYTAGRRSAEGAGVKVDLAAGTASTYYLKASGYIWADANGQIALANIENIRGSTQGDSLTGDNNANSIDGGMGSDVINGGGGNDTLDGGASDVYNPSIVDILSGDAGNDTFLVRGFFGAGYYNGGADTDLLDFSQADAYTAGRRSAEGAGVNVDLAAGKASTYYLSATNYTWADANGQLALTSIENIIGTNQNDQLYGDANANTLEGGAGNDVLYGAGGIDTLKGGIGNDTYYVGYAGDVLDTVTEITGEGNDIVWSALSAYTLADNVETLTLLAGAISGTGNGLDNTLVGNSISNTLNGGAGNDTLDGGVSDVYNPSVIDTLNGDAGNDTFLSRGFFGAGNYNGGADTDLLDFSQSDNYTAGRRSAEGAGVKVDLAAGTASTYYLKASGYIWADANGQIALANIENIRGSTQGDSLTGDNNANSIDGGMGSDVINGGGGNDTLDGGASDVYNPSIVDILSGDAGNDTFLVRGFFGAGYYNGGADTDLLDFSQADAYTAGRRSAEGAGVNVDLAAGKASTYYLSATNYTWADANGQLAVAAIENVRGTGQSDRLSGDNGINVLDGADGNDFLAGGLSKDYYLLQESTAATDTLKITTGDSLVSSFDVVSDFKLGTGSSPTAAGVDRLDLSSISIAADANNVNGVDFGSIGSHSISNGLISFVNVSNGTPLAITAANLTDAVNYVQTAITGNNTVAFIVDNNTFVFQDGGVTDTLVELIGVTASGVSTTGLVSGAVWIV